MKGLKKISITFLKNKKGYGRRKIYKQQSSGNFGNFSCFVVILKYNKAGQGIINFIPDFKLSWEDIEFTAVIRSVVVLYFLAMLHNVSRSLTK